MEILGGILALLTLLTLLAAVGITTLAAFVLMAALGLLTDMSFKRLFFVSFAIGLAAPILLGLGVGAAFADGTLERELRAELGRSVDIPATLSSNWRQAVPQFRDLRERYRAGEISESEFERRIEALIEQASTVEIRARAIDDSTDDGSETIRSN